MPSVARLSDVCALVVLTALLINNLRSVSFSAAATTLLIICTWILLTCHRFDGGSVLLPTREAFMDNLQHLPLDELPPEQRECRICYDEHDSAVRLPCGHVFCADCVRRVFAPEMKDHRCPYCRRALFRIAAPWDTFVIKILICNSVLLLVGNILEAALAIHTFEVPELGWRGLMDGWAFLDKFLRIHDGLAALKLVRENLNEDGRMFWEAYNSRWPWILVPLEVWSVVKKPWVIQSMVDELLEGRRV